MQLTDAVKSLAAGSDKPSLVALSYALRHPDWWPKGFVWDYGNCTTCAMGLAARLWKLTGYPGEHSDRMRNPEPTIKFSARVFDMSVRDARRIFLETDVTNGCYMEDVTPGHVADAIDRYLERV